MPPTQWLLSPLVNHSFFYEPALFATTEWDAYLSPSPYRATPTPTGTVIERLTTDAISLVLAAPHIHIPALTVALTDDWLVRLHTLYSINTGFRHLDTPEGPVPYPLDRHTLHRHEGLLFPSVPYLSPEEFHTRVRPLILHHCDNHAWSPAHATPRRQPLQ